jgi:hypothetical protein
MDEDEESFCTKYGCRTIFKELKPFIIQEAKKEVFDDIELHRRVGTPEVIIEDYQELKKRHLSTFPKEEKRHNSFIQNCSHSFCPIWCEGRCTQSKEVYDRCHKS